MFYVGDTDNLVDAEEWIAETSLLALSQDANLNMLINWMEQYAIRRDTFSQSAHEDLFHGYEGKKTMYIDNQRRNSQ